MRCETRIMPPFGAPKSIRCMGEAGHPADHIDQLNTPPLSGHWHTRRNIRWTDGSPDIVQPVATNDTQA